MKKVLCAWIGKQDLISAEADGANGLGDICQVATLRHYDELLLLSDYPPDVTSPYLGWLVNRNVKNAHLTTVNLHGNPANFSAIYEGAKNALQEYLHRKKSRVEFTFHISAGTHAMTTVWVILSNSIFPARLVHSSPERALQDVTFPFDIIADYLPDFIQQKQKKLSAIFADQEIERAEFEAIIHQSPTMKKLIQRARIIAPYPVSVLIQGESGTGKELLANAIHQTSLRKGKFFAINCGAIPADLFESELFGYKKGSFNGAEEDQIGYIEDAEGGTLFLDDIGEMPPEIQVKLLRVLQESKFNRVGEPVDRHSNIRIISATNRNLQDLISAGLFRKDLFHRLAVGILYIPPLRMREGDLGLLIDHLMTVTNNKLSVSWGYKPKVLTDKARSLLMAHSWPGNVRELKNTLTRAALWSMENVIDNQAIADAMLP